MRKLGLIFLLMVLIGCSTARIPAYISTDHSAVRKISGDYGEIVATIKQTLRHEGWQIDSIVNPALYERHDGGEDQSNDLLILMKPRKHFRVLYSTYANLNIFTHQTADGAEVDIRSNPRNDKLNKMLLNEIEQSIEGK